MDISASEPLNLNNMKIMFIVTIDTEMDKSLSWNVSVNETFNSVLYGIPDTYTPLFDEFGVKPTYLLSSEVINHQGCIRVLKNINNCELGTHLHGELVEPEGIKGSLSNISITDMECSYSKEIEYKKLKNLTVLFKEKLGYLPTSFRAGRFGAGDNTIPSLERLGYLVDSSVTPGVDWNYPEGRANYIMAREQPYFPSKDNLLNEGSTKILEVPVSITTSKFRKPCYSAMETIRFPLVNHMVDRIFPAHWLRPSCTNASEMIQVITKLVKFYQRNKVVVLNMMFHSMEIIPCASPYTKNEEESHAFLERIRMVFKYCLANNITFVKMSDLYSMFITRN